MVSTVSVTLEAFLAPYARHFRSLGWTVDAAAHGATANPVLNDAFDHVYDLPLSRSLLDVRGLVRGRAALSEVLRSRPDIVHVHTPIAGFLTRLTVRQLPAAERPAVVYTAHGFHFYDGGSPLTNRVFRVAEQVAGRWTDRLVVINEEDRAAAERYHVVPSRRLVHVPGIGVDTAKYRRSDVDTAAIAAVRHDLGLESATPLFVVVGELNRNKRQKDVIQALAAMRHRGAHVALAGRSGPEAAKLDRLAAELGLADRVHCLGFVGNVRPLICAATAVILPSAREGLARSVMEALALEVPVIASTARGNRELIGDDAGVVCPIGDVACIAEAMDRLLERPEEAAEMGRRGRRRMAEVFELEPIIGRHEALYRELLDERGRQRS